MAGAFRLASPAAIAADHKEAPGVRLDPSADINDVYAFTDPGNASNLVLVMTVNPFIPPPENTAFFFDPTVKYIFHIDNKGDSMDHQDFTVTFGALDAASQQAITVNNVAAGKTTPASDAVTAPAAVINTFTLNGATATIFAGERQDPFFFDFVGFVRLLGGGAFPRTAPPDSFAGVNVDAIVLEVPITTIAGTSGNTKFGIWATTGR